MAGSHNFTIERGATWNATVGATVNGSEVNHSGYTVEMDVRETPLSSTTLYTLTTANSRITVSGTAINLALTAAETAAIGFESGDYDLKVTSPGGTVNYYLRGKFRVIPTVSR
jgi:hypothetical protein